MLTCAQERAHAYPSGMPGGVITLRDAIDWHTPTSNVSVAPMPPPAAPPAALLELPLTLPPTLDPTAPPADPTVDDATAAAAVTVADSVTTAVAVGTPQQAASSHVQCHLGRAPSHLPQRHRTRQLAPTPRTPSRRGSCNSRSCGGHRESRCHHESSTTPQRGNACTHTDSMQRLMVPNCWIKVSRKHVPSNAPESR